MSLLSLPELAVIRRMLHANLRPTEIARRLGMPVETVTLVATSRKLRRRKLHLLTEDDLPDDYDAPPDYLAANLRRCEGCGGTVYRWPCLLCRIRAAQASGVVLPDEEDCIAATSGRDDAEEAAADGENERQRDGETEGEPSFSFSPSLRLAISPSSLNSEQVHLPMEPSHAHS